MNMRLDELNSNDSIFEKLMIYTLVLFALMSNVSSGITTGCLILGLLILLVQYIKNRRLPNCDLGILKAVGIYSLIWFILCFFSLDQSISFKAWLATFYRFSPLFFVLMYVRSKNQYLCLMVAFAFSVVIDCGVAIFQAITIGPRPEGLNNNPNFVAVFMLLAFPVLLHSSFQNWKKKWCTYLFSIGVILSVVTLVLTQTRGAWLSFAITVIVMAFISRNHKKLVLLIVGFLIFSIAVLFFLYPEFLARILSSANLEAHSANLRLQFWEASINIFKDYPYWGIGLDMFAPVHNNIYALTEDAARYGNPHSNYFKILTEGGVVGFVSFILFHGYIIRRMLMNLKQHCMKDDFSVMGVLFFLAFHLSGITDMNINNVPMMREFWFLTGMSLVGSKLFYDK